MKKLFACICIISGLMNFRVLAQHDTGAEGFRMPIDGAIFVSGTFGELRQDHFHSGTDFSTKGRIGQNIYAVADGWVSRVRVSSRGYGKAVYLTHYNGYVSVYAHLSEFSLPVNDYVLRKQYENESFEIELFPPQGLFTFKKGEIVGFSGNTGSSTGPHLHFEIRREKTERPINPAFFGIHATDNIFPVVHNVRAYAFGDGSRVNGKKNHIHFKALPGAVSNTYRISDTVRVEGCCYLGIQSNDFVSDRNRTGLFSADVVLDTHTYFSFVMDSFSFSETRYINNFIDYEEYMKTRARFQLFRISPGNQFPVYRDVQNRGILCFEKDSVIQAEIIVKDFAGNKAVVNMVISGKAAPSSGVEQAAGRDMTVFTHDRPGRFEKPDIIVDIPEGALYDSIIFAYKARNEAISPYSKIHSVHNRFVPLHKSITISIAADSVPVALQSKAVLARYESSGKHGSAGGEVYGRYIRAQTLRFGDYFIMVDTVAPGVRPVNFRNGQHIGKLTSLNLKITDGLSGIGHYRAEINGNWVFMEFDAKNDLLSIPVNDKVPVGTFELVIKVEDKCHNVTHRKYDLIR
jgi:hypothetical protein